MMGDGGRWKCKKMTLWGCFYLVASLLPKYPPISVLPFFTTYHTPLLFFLFSFQTPPFLLQTRQQVHPPNLALNSFSTKTNKIILLFSLSSLHPQIHSQFLLSNIINMLPILSFNLVLLTYIIVKWKSTFLFFSIQRKLLCIKT